MQATINRARDGHFNLFVGGHYAGQFPSWVAAADYAGRLGARVSL